MSLFRPLLLPALRALLKTSSAKIREEVFHEKVRLLFPETHFEWPINLVVDDFSALRIGARTFIGPYSEVIVSRLSPSSKIAGNLVIEAGVRIGMGANIRAAGGAIVIGHNTQVGQHVSLIASNHAIDKSTGVVDADQWDTNKTGIGIGENCWIGAGVIILPGVTIGSGTIIGAGSVVTKSVGENQLWHGNPARSAKTRLCPQ